MVYYSSKIFKELQIISLQKMLKNQLFLLCFCCFLMSCSIKNTVDYFEAKIYKLDVQQGNIITAEMLMGLKPGMTRTQVRFVLGTPLIQDSFHKNRWDYLYKMIKNEVLIEERHIIVKFEDDQLVSVDGDLINQDDVMLGAQTEKQSKVITLTKEDYENEKEDDKSMLSKLKFWDDDEKDSENQDTIKISKKDIEEDKNKDDGSILSKFKFWEDDKDEPTKEDVNLKFDSDEKIPEKINTETKIEADNKAVEFEEQYQIDDRQSLSQSIKEDIINSLPDEADPAYFDLLLEKIGF